MSTSIHAHAEIKVNDTWLHYTKFNIETSYELFNKIAGINNNNYKEGPISPTRGLPKDISASTKFHHDHLACISHNATWLNALDIHSLHQWMDKKHQNWSIDTFGYCLGNSWKCFVDYPSDSWNTSIEDIRFIFWFDN